MGLNLQAGVAKERIFTVPFISMMIADFCMKICTSMQISLLPLYVVERGLSGTLAGLTTTAFMLPALLFRPFTGEISDEKGPYTVMIFGAALFLAATGFYFFAIPVAALLIMRALQGVGFSFDSTGIYALATDYIPDSRMSEGIGYLGLAQTLSSAVGPPTALWLKNSFGYNAAFTTVFLLSALALVVILLLRFALKVLPKSGGGAGVKNRPAASGSAERGPFFARIIDKNALKPGLIILLCMFAANSFSTFLVTYATKGGIENPGLFFTAQAIAVTVSRLVMGKIHRRMGTAFVLTAGASLMFLGFALLVLPLSLPLLLLCGTCYGLGFGAVLPLLNSLAVLSADKDHRGVANSTFFMMMDSGGAIGGIVFGTVADVWGYAAIYAIAAGVIASALTSYHVMRKRGMVQ